MDSSSYFLHLLANPAPVLFGYPWIASKCHGKCQRSPKPVTDRYLYLSRYWSICLFGFQWRC